MKSRVVSGQNQKRHPVTKAIRIHRKNQILIFQGNLKLLSTEEMEIEGPNRCRIP